ncbi:MAG: ACT domain-containing protein [Bacillota bacterium]
MDDGERTRRLVAEAAWQVGPAEIAIAAFPQEAGPRVLAALASGDVARPVWWADDGFEVTVVAPREVLEAEDLGSIPGTRVERGWALVTCLTPLPWDVVGFLAEVTARLARAGITCGALSAYSRDHLLVPWSRREEVLSLLARGDPQRLVASIDDRVRGNEKLAAGAERRRQGEREAGGGR